MDGWISMDGQNDFLKNTQEQNKCNLSCATLYTYNTDKDDI